MTQPDMTGKTILVTGSTDGIGKQTALELARLGASVLIHGRNPERVQAAVEEIRTGSGNEHLSGLCADLSSMAEVHRLSKEVQAAAPRLDVLIHNAGNFNRERILTVDGFELTLAVNYLAPFLLTHHLMETLRASAPARVVVLSSILHIKARLELDNLNGEQNYSGRNAYASAKLCATLFARELAERNPGSGISAYSLHPGVIDTKLLRVAFPTSGDPVEEGAVTPVYLASADGVEQWSGRYFDFMRPAPASALCEDADLRRQLWETTAKMLEI